jgi:hypothetical protein
VAAGLRADAAVVLEVGELYLTRHGHAGLFKGEPEQRIKARLTFFVSGTVAAVLSLGRFAAFSSRFSCTRARASSSKART